MSYKVLLQLIAVIACAYPALSIELVENWLLDANNVVSKYVVPTDSVIKFRCAMIPSNLEGRYVLRICDGNGAVFTDNSGKNIQWILKGSGQIETFRLSKSEKIMIKVGQEKWNDAWAKRPIFNQCQIIEMTAIDTGIHLKLHDLEKDSPTIQRLELDIKTVPTSF